MKHLSLCSGIGGIDLAAHMAGIETTTFCEIEKYPVEVLKLRFPGKKIINDVREVNGREFGGIDVISGGFPCQPFSVAGKRKGVFDTRHLFPELARIVAEAQPEWFVGENVRGIFSIRNELGVKGGVLGDCISRLSAVGYAVGWCCYGAVDVGAPHRRDRIFILANRDPEKVKKVIEIVRGILTPWQGDCWPTPVSSDGTVGSVISKDDLFVKRSSGKFRKINRNGTDGSLGLSRMVTILANPWPTPRANDAEKRGNIANDKRNGLPSSVLWNTPTARDYKDASLPPSRITKDSVPGDIMRINKLWPTPRGGSEGVGLCGGSGAFQMLTDNLGREMAIRMGSGNGGKLNPDWVALLMGFPVGWASLGNCENYFRGWPAGIGPYQYEYEPDRLTEKCENRAKQLKGYGNAVVPYQILPVFKALREVAQ